MKYLMPRTISKKNISEQNDSMLRRLHIRCPFIIPYHFPPQLPHNSKSPRLITPPGRSWSDPPTGSQERVANSVVRIAPWTKRKLCRRGLRAAQMTKASEMRQRDWISIRRQKLLCVLGVGQWKASTGLTFDCLSSFHCLRSGKDRLHKYREGEGLVAPPMGERVTES